ncbi:MAG: DUF3786 domain-containing protein [Armatimonadetes bacterium]|nr:DUF3786 domain-containing protein [Armatimonadota bacterium]
MRLPYQDHYEVAARTARDALRQSDIRERCARSGADYQAENRLVAVPLLRETLRVTWPDLEFLPDGTGAAPALREQILALHYLVTATGAAPTGNWVTFDQVPGGLFYLPAFRGRSVDRLVRAFGERPERLADAARALGGAPAAHGDVGVVVPMFPRVALLLVLWRGDDEIAPSGNVLFDSSVRDYLPTEDIAVAAGMVVGECVRCG